MKTTALESYLISTHKKLNPDRDKYISTYTLAHVAMGEVYKYGTALTPRNTISNTHTTNPELFETTGRGKWRLTDKAHKLNINHEDARINLVTKIKKDEQIKITKELLELSSSLSTITEGSKYVAKRSYIMRSPKVRKYALAFHGHRCAVCERTPSDFGPQYNDSILEAHHINELHTYEAKGITETDIRTDMAIVCVLCHRCNIHLTGSITAQSIQEARKYHEDNS